MYLSLPGSPDPQVREALIDLFAHAQPYCEAFNAFLESNPPHTGKTAIVADIVSSIKQLVDRTRSSLKEYPNFDYKQLSRSEKKCPICEENHLTYAFSGQSVLARVTMLACKRYCNDDGR